MATLPRPVLAAALLLLVPAVQGLLGTFERQAMGPTGELTTGTWSGTTSCDPAAPSGNVLSCSEYGFSATIDISSLNENGVGAADPAGGYVWAYGTCAAKQVFANSPATIGRFAFLCGVDRDDDGLVTDHDLAATDPDGFDDDFAGGVVTSPGGAGSVDVCFRADGASATASTAGASWDFAFVFVVRDTASPNPAEGVFDVDLDLETTTLGCPGNASGHTHDAWQGAGANGAQSCGTVVAGLCQERLWIG